MEGRSRNFERVLADFESRLPDAAYVAIDCELTGVDVNGDPDSFAETADVRLAKARVVAETYSIIQLGITLVSPAGKSGCWTCASYNFFMFPWTGPELGGREACFTCQASSLLFNGQHNLDFNAWINESVYYMNREDEAKYLETAASENDVQLPSKVGMLRLWKALCARRLPLIVHCPLDLFFVLAAFERHELPKDQRELALLVRQCFREVYDTAHLHGRFRSFHRLGLMKFYEDAQGKHARLYREGRHVAPVSFEFTDETAARYESGSEFAHEAAYDSLVTAKLFLYLQALSPKDVTAGTNRLYLHKSAECIDLDRANADGTCSGSAFGHDVTLFAAELEQEDDFEAVRAIKDWGAEYKWMNPTVVLVVLRKFVATNDKQKLNDMCNDLQASVPRVCRCLHFDDWLAAARRDPDGRAAIVPRLSTLTAAKAIAVFLALLSGLRPRWRQRLGRGLRWFLGLA